MEGRAANARASLATGRSLVRPFSRPPQTVPMASSSIPPACVLPTSTVERRENALVSRLRRRRRPSLAALAKPIHACQARGRPFGENNPPSLERTRQKRGKVQGRKNCSVNPSLIMLVFLQPDKICSFRKGKWPKNLHFHSLSRYLFSRRLRRWPFVWPFISLPIGPMISTARQRVGRRPSGRGISPSKDPLRAALHTQLMTAAYHGAIGSTGIISLPPSTPSLTPAAAAAAGGDCRCLKGSGISSREFSHISVPRPTK